MVRVVPKLRVPALKGWNMQNPESFLEILGI
jgi:hypothetical protein